MYRKPLLKNQCKFCSIIGTKKNPVKYGVCSRCKEKSKEFPKKVKCFICGKEMTMDFPAWSQRGNCCIACDIEISRKARINGYPTIPENRAIFLEKQAKLKHLDSRKETS